MLPLNYGLLYKPPTSHQPPEDAELSGDIEYPNLNSRDYSRRPLNRTIRMQPALECIDISPNESDERRNIIICCNKLGGREWVGSLWGFETMTIRTDNFSLKEDRACYKMQSDALINCLQFITSSNFLLALNSGKVQLWSIQLDAKHSHNSNNLNSLSLIEEKCEHIKPIVCLTVFKCNSCKAISGSKDGSMKIWDICTGDLYSSYCYTFAHSDIVTGVTSSLANDALFASCSLDKSTLLWDDRETRPSIGLYENHKVRFKDICWSDTNENILYLGDECGSVMTIDIRLPNTFITTQTYFNRSIRKMKAKRDKLALIADSNIVKVLNTQNDEIIYENCDSKYFTRDIAWLLPNELLSIGFDGKLRQHNIKIIK